MTDVYIRAEDLNRWIVRRLPQNKDLYTINDLIGAIEDMDGEIEELKEKLEEKENDYPEEERDREIEVIGNE